MQGIRKDGGASGDDTAKAFKNGKCKIQQECNQNIMFCFHKGPPLDYMIIFGTINSIVNILFGFIVQKAMEQNNMQISASVSYGTFF